MPNWSDIELTKDDLPMWRLAKLAKLEAIECKDNSEMVKVVKQGNVPLYKNIRY